ncbi:receptor-like protein kinase [Seminavis robusta]|uniref:Receptor-like protein kinase n=1 Tax=Seminavis robusta TaxID=568900 RepID=A0A9N8DP47_9STRA|nr:receptor-like protein kinase [Seminavis robusta]|eukprot:Sro187_g081020.1 receptor-like protein kinase (543) ;mRNA; r:76616-78272
MVKPKGDNDVTSNEAEDQQSQQQILRDVLTKRSELEARQMMAAVTNELERQHQENQEMPTSQPSRTEYKRPPLNSSAQATPSSHMNNSFSGDRGILKVLQDRASTATAAVAEEDQFRDEKTKTSANQNDKVVAENTASTANETGEQPPPPTALRRQAPHQSRPGAYMVAPGESIQRTETLNFGMLRNVANTVTTFLNALDAEVSAVELGGPDESSESQSPKSQSRKCVLLALVGLLVVIITVGGVCGSGVCSGGSSEQVVPTMPPTSQKYFEHQMAILDFFGEDYFDGMDIASSQYKALDWITNDLIVPEDDHFIQRFVLAVFYFHTSQQSRWVACAPRMISCDDNHGDYIGVIWMHASNECLWGGIECDDKSGRVTELSMIHNDLNGKLPTELAVLSKLTVLNLRDNRLTGPLPSELYTLASLEELNLSHNSLSGEISTEIGLLTSLSKMDISNNQFFGRLPEEISALTGLYQFDIHGNDGLHGKIPQAVCDSANSHNENEEIIVKADCVEYTSLPSEGVVTCPKDCCTECCSDGGCYPAE